MIRKKVIGLIVCFFIVEGFLGWLMFKRASTPPCLKAETHEINISEINVPVEECTEIIGLIPQNQEYQENESIEPEVSFEDGVVIREEKKELIRVKEDAIEPESKDGAVKKEELPDLIYKEKVIQPEDQ